MAIAGLGIARVARIAALVGLILAPVAGRAESGLEERLRPAIEGHKGTVAVAVKHLGTGESYGYRDAEPMPTASLIKLAVMVEAYRQADAGTLDLAQPVTLREVDKVPGSGILTDHFSAGAQLPLRDLIRLMIRYSDNTATNLVLDRIGLPSTAAAMESLGLPHTKIHAKVFRGETSIFPDRSRRFGLGSTTAAETVRLLELLHAGKAARAESCRAMLDHLRACESRATLPRLLPAGTKVAHKTGSVTAVRTAAGIIESPRGPIAVCVLTRDNEDRRWTDENAAEILCARIARAAYDHFNPPSAGDPLDPAPAELTTGASGWLVEALQRTLNRRLSPSPQLGVDGEFGPSTRKAVLEFQRARGLAATGTVDAATWQALGPLATEDEPPPDAETLARQTPARSPADPLDGTPFVTCKAWAVGDPRSGEVLWGENAAQPLDIASTTKLMTAWLVLRRADADPQALDAALTVSERADRTPGSTAGLRAGETESVRDALYGLLLPSGNDAAVALAEHFGPSFAPPADRPDATGAVDRFVAEMNRAAQELGMTGTRFANPHGLPAPGHQATAGDLVKLAAVICRDGWLLPYAATRQHVGFVRGRSGYQRRILWKNTNRLLQTEGYLGLKTGTTTAAGACLVSLGERNADRLIVVILGSASDESRYADTRNLYRWAWRQRTATATEGQR